MTRRQLAESFGVNADTVYEWAKRHPVFYDAIHGGAGQAAGGVA